MRQIRLGIAMRPLAISAKFQAMSLLGMMQPTKTTRHQRMRYGVMRRWPPRYSSDFSPK